MSQPTPFAAGEVKFPVMDDSAPPTPSHQELFSAVFHHARAIVALTEVVPVDCEGKGNAVPAVQPPMYAVVAYRWGNVNQHWYYVYVGSDQVKAVTLAESETHERGGKYGCAVYEFDGQGIDYQLIFYSPSMQEDQSAKAPTHNHRIDYFEKLGMLVDHALDGEAWLPDPQHPGQLKTVQVQLPDWMQAEVKRQREVLRAMSEAEVKK